MYNFPQGGSEMSIISERLKALMDQNKVTYQMLAYLTGVSKSTICRYLTGTTAKIPTDRLWQFASALNTTPQYLVGETDDPLPYPAKKNDSQNETKDEYEMVMDRMDRDPEFRSLVNLLLKLDESEIVPYASFMRVIIEKKEEDSNPKE